MRNQVSETWNSLVRVILQAWASTCLKVEVLWMPNVVCRRRQWHPTPGFLPGKSHGRRSLVDCSPWGCKESDTTDWLHFHFSHALEKEMATHSVFLPGESQGQQSLVGCHLWGHTESDTTEATQQQQQQQLCLFPAAYALLPSSWGSSPGYYYFLWRYSEIEYLI